jgi:hypothetical protein
MSKKYVIISPFTYRGNDGKAKQMDQVRFGPGEEVPVLDNDELNRLIMQEKIAEVSKETGSIIPNKKITNLNNTEIERMMTKSIPSLLAVINSGELSIETLSKMLVIAEREKMDNRVKTTIEEQINKKVSD